MDSDLVGNELHESPNKTTWHLFGPCDNIDRTVLEEWRCAVGKTTGKWGEPIQEDECVNEDCKPSYVWRVNLTDHDLEMMNAAKLSSESLWIVYGGR